MSATTPTRSALLAHLTAAIGAVVRRRGGDAGDLTFVSHRALADCDRRAAAIRSQVTLRPCGCADGGVDPDGGHSPGRGGRFFGRRLLPARSGP